MFSFLDATQAAPVTPVTAHWMEALGLVMAYSATKFIEFRQGKKHSAHTKLERTAELDSRVTSLASAISLGQQSNESEFGKINTRLTKIDGTMEVVKGEVAGLRQRELDRLTDAATPARGVRRK